MAFTDNIKEITPAITQLKSNTPVIVIDGKIYVAGIGGNFIPGSAAASQSGTANIAAGYITISDSIITVHNVTDGTTSTTDKLYIADTGVEEPAYQSGGGGSATGMDFYKCAAVYSDSTWSGYKLLQNANNGYTLQSQSTLIGIYYVKPTVDKLYDSTGKLQLKTYYDGDNYDPYGDGLLYSIFINGGTGVSAPSEGIVTTDNYTSDVETVDGITARKFTGNQKVTTTTGTSRSIFSASVWIKASDGYAIGGTSNIMRLQFRGWTEAEFQYSGSGNLCTIYPPNSNWHYYTVTCDGTSYKVYFDTELKGTVNSLTAFPDTAAGLCFGHDGINSTTGVYYFSGYIANFRFYDHVLTSSEIAALYAELTPSN